MKKKLKSVFLLIILSLTGIIVFQVYWTINSYNVNKEKFDGNIDLAMQRALDDCKKDYFDSIRVVMVKRLSAPPIKIKIDTNEMSLVFKFTNGMPGINFMSLFATPKKGLISLLFLGSPSSHPQKPLKKRPGWVVKSVSHYSVNNHPVSKQSTIVFSEKNIIPNHETEFKTSVYQFDRYRKKIKHPATVPEVLTEMSFYVPELLDDLTRLMMFPKPNPKSDSSSRKTKNKLLKAFTSSSSAAVFDVPPNHKAADSLKISRYLNAELHKTHIYSSFSLYYSNKPVASQKPNAHYSETNEYPYKYYGFVQLGISNISDPFYVRAVFRNPQYAVLKNMLLTLVLSLLLIALTIYCFSYIARTILEQKKLADLKDDFINNMTHELKTPIATITVAIEGMQKFNALNDPEKTQRYLQTSRDELNRLNELVSKVLNIAVFENKEITLIKEKINIDELINDVITSEKLKTDKQVSITYNNADKVTTIDADRFHFRNVLINLIDNAIKYSKEPVNIIITCSKSGKNAVLSIKDNGIGIPAEHIRQVFDKFHRVPTGNIHNVKGTGLGLSYVKYIVEAHGGKVMLKSEINAGSEFIVTIPLAHG